MHHSSRLFRYCIWFLLIQLFGCSAAGNTHKFFAKELKGWQKNCGENDCYYGFTCNRSTVWMSLQHEYEIRWMGPVFFPWFFPTLLLNKYSGDNLKIHLEVNNDDQIKFIPRLKLADGTIIRPGQCSKWVAKQSVKQAFCEFDKLVWELPPFAVEIESNSPDCLPPPLEIERQVTPFYAPHPGR